VSCLTYLGAEEWLKALVADGRAVWEETGLCWRPAAVKSLYEVTGTALHKKLWNSLATDHPIFGLQQLQNHRELQTQDKDKKPCLFQIFKLVVVCWCQSINVRSTKTATKKSTLCSSTAWVGTEDIDSDFPQEITNPVTQCQICHNSEVTNKPERLPENIGTNHRRELFESGLLQDVLL